MKNYFVECEKVKCDNCNEIKKIYRVDSLIISPKISEQINLILYEYNNAVFKHPEFVRSILEANAILVEEVGEVSKAIIEGSKEELRTEIAQVAAVCIRMLEFLEQN